MMTTTGLEKFMCTVMKNKTSVLLLSPKLPFTITTISTLLKSNKLISSRKKRVLMRTISMAQTSYAIPTYILVSVNKILTKLNSNIFASCFTVPNVSQLKNECMLQGIVRLLLLCLFFANREGGLLLSVCSLETAQFISTL